MQREAIYGTLEYVGGSLHVSAHSFKLKLAAASDFNGKLYITVSSPSYATDKIVLIE